MDSALSNQSVLDNLSDQKLYNFKVDYFEPNDQKNVLKVVEIIKNKYYKL